MADSELVVIYEQDIVTVNIAPQEAVVIHEPEVITVEVEARELVIVETGIQGPPGPPGVSDTSGFDVDLVTIYNLSK